MQKALSFLLILALLCGLLPACAEGTLAEKALPLYLDNIDEVDEIHLVFPDGNEEIPYVAADEMCRLMNLIYGTLTKDEGYQLTLSPQGVNALLVRENGSDMYIDFENGILSAGQFVLFTSASKASGILDLVYTGKSSTGHEGQDIDLIRHEGSYTCNGSYTALNLKEYGIPSPVINGTGYLPLQTFSDILVSPSGAVLCWNGQTAAVMTSTSISDKDLKLTPLGELYYSVPVRERSEALVEFNLNELCLALDFHYGLKEEHGIEGFQDYFIRSGLLQDLLSSDARVSSTALKKLCMAHFEDGHSSLVSVSPYSDYNADTLDADSMSVGIVTRLMNILEYVAARMTAYPEGMPAYEEVGNTAYVTFDTFILDTEKDYYSQEIPENMTSDTADTIELLAYAGRQINRENSPIENVVIDLSNNGGGMLDVAVSVCAWVLGSSTLHISDANSGAQSSTLYSFDGNLNHVFGEKEDSVNDKNIFCLISPNSFSCGNLVPAAFRSSGKVTLLGKASSGGACAVQLLSTADGTLFCISGRYRINTSNNGILYSVDAGVEPHYYLPKASMFYDRQKLTEYINSLIW